MSESLPSLPSTRNEDPTVLERLAKRLSQMKLILYGDGEKEVDKEKCEVRTYVRQEGRW